MRDQDMDERVMGTRIRGEKGETTLMFGEGQRQPVVTSARGQGVDDAATILLGDDLRCVKEIKRWMRGAWTEESERGEGGHPYHGCCPHALYREGWRQQFFPLEVLRLHDEGCSGKIKFAAAGLSVLM